MGTAVGVACIYNTGHINRHVQYESIRVQVRAWYLLIFEWELYCDKYSMTTTSAYKLCETRTGLAGATVGDVCAWHRAMHGMHEQVRSTRARSVLRLVPLCKLCLVAASCAPILVPKIDGLHTVQNVCVHTVVWIQFTLQSVCNICL